MTALVALLPLLVAAGPPPRGPAPAPARAAAVRSVASPLVRAPPPVRAQSHTFRPVRELRPPPGRTLAAPLGFASTDLLSSPGEDAWCLAAACAPRHPWLPDDPTPPRGTRRDLLLALLARSPFERLSSAATAIAESPVQIDYTPGGTGRERGWGRVSVALRWRLDATGPARPEAPR